jgi:uncharacterized 2Fe-2S/4Fe-4S cluster protein (DUF4445 family)
VATVQVTFLPDAERADVEPGTTLLDAAVASGLPLDGECGGRGVCHRCAVSVVGGHVEALEGGPPSVVNDRVLACRTVVRGDVTVDVPPTSRIEGLEILTGADRAAGILAPTAELSGGPALDEARYPLDPVAVALPMTLPRPTIDEALSDLGLLRRELRREHGIEDLSVPLSVLRRLPHRIRASGRLVTAVLARVDGRHELLDLMVGREDHPVFGLAVDIGTTTVVVHLVDLGSGETIGVAAALNSQVAYGEDVITRIIHAGEPGGLDQLRSGIVDEINVLVGSLALAHHVNRHDIVAAVVAGNTTMIHLFLGLPPAEIRREPYVPVATAPLTYHAGEVGLRIHARAVIGCMPGSGSYVGGDISADVLASGMDRRPELAMLIDAGTNGETVIGNRDFLVCCACSAGPAFEGGGTSCGMRAAHGAIAHVESAGEGGLSYQTIGDAPPRGICGSGFVELLAALLHNGTLDRSGHLREGAPMVRDGELGLEALVAPASGTATGEDIVLTEADLEILLRSKAAVYAGASVLARRLGIDMAEIERIYVAGGFGTSLDVQKAMLIGLLPDVPAERVSFIGNGSVSGARMALLSRAAWQRAAEVAEMMTYRDLSADGSFMDEYVGALFLPHTDSHRFPRAHAALGVH